MLTNGKICTVYLLSNTINNKIYIGQTWSPLYIRMGKDGSNYKNSIYLYSAIQKYGTENFQYKILAECKDQITADVFEEYYINWYDTKNSEIGYNLKNGGSAGKHSEETKDKISESIKNKIWSETAIFNRSQTGKMWKGKKRGPQSEYRTSLTSESMKKWHSENAHPMLGKHHSEEARIKIGLKNKGRKIDPNVIIQRSLKRRMDSTREQNIIQAYQNGDIIDKIEETFKTGRSSIYRILKRNNISNKLLKVNHDSNLA